MNHLSIWLLIISLCVIQPCQGLVVVDSTLASACVYYLNTFDWGCGGHGTGMRLYKCRCANVDWLGSVSSCIVQENNSSRLVDHAMRHVAGRCLSKGGFHYTVEDFHAWQQNATEYLEDPQDEDHTMAVTHPLRTNTSEWEYYHKSFKDFTFEVQKSQWFGWGLVFYWSSIMFVATLVNLNRKFFHYGLFDSNMWKRHLLLPSISKKFTNNEQTYWFAKVIPLQFPTRLQTLIVVMFIVQVCITSSVGYTLSLPNAYINRRWYMNLDLISYRTDMMAISLFPIIFLFGIRNNPFIYLTGWSFATFNVYHRWTAIVMVVLAFIHSIIWTVDAIMDGGYKSWVMDLYFQYGIAATTISFLLIFHSEKVIRDIAYEVFLLFHKLFNIFFIVTMYYHCNTLGWLGWIWSMAGIMVFDRVIRIIRIMLSGGVQKTRMTRCDNDVIKLYLNKPKFFNYSLGSYAFIYFMNPWYTCWQSHPFTVVSSPLEEDDGKLVIYFKAKKGITGRLLRRLLRSEDQEIDIRVIVEGPYGNSINTTTLLNDLQKRFVGISGGLGVVSVFPHFVELLKDKPINTDEKYSVSEKSSRSLTELSMSLLPTHKLYWVINDMSNLLWFHNELKWLSQRGCEVNIIFTGGDKSQSELSTSLTEVSSVLVKSELYLVNSFTRPDFYRFINDDYRACCDTGEDMECFACGPASFNDDLRAAVLRVLTENPEARSDLSYNVESFTW